MTDTPMTPAREQEIRETHPGGWYDGPWTHDYVEGEGGEPDYWRVVHHESGTALATLPDWAGGIALFIADAHDAVPELLAEVNRLRKALSEAADQVAELESDLGGATAKSASLKAELSDRAAENRELRREAGKAADLVRRGRHEQADALLRALARDAGTTTSEDADLAQALANLEAMRADHPAPCRVPDSPDCTCPDEEVLATSDGLRAALRSHLFGGGRGLDQR